MNPKVSILVPIYGVEKFIERCAVSLFEQSFSSIEYIFVNDCTKDNSIGILNEVISRYALRKHSVRIINHNQNKGLAGARNTGVEEAKGDYILHVDSDDYLEFNMVEVMYQKAIEETADIVICDMFLEWPNERKIVNQKFKSKIDLLQQMLEANTIVGLVNKMIKRSLYVENSITSFEGVNLGEDFVTTPRLVYYANKVSKVNAPLYHYVQFNTNSYTKNINDRSIQNVVFVLEVLTAFFKEKKEISLLDKSLPVGILRKKIELLLNSKRKYWHLIEKLFDNMSIGDYKTMVSMNYRIVGYLSSKKLYISLSIYIKLYTFLFLSYQWLMKR